MMEVLLRFPAIGTIENYHNLPKGEQILYEQFILIRRSEEAELSGMKLAKSILK